MKNVSVCLCLLILGFSLMAEERIEIQSSLISTSTTSLVVGGKISSSKAKVTLQLSVDGATTGANFPAAIAVDSLQPTWVISTALSGSTSPTAYTTGTHTVLISMVEFGTVTPILATASAIMTVETARSHIWLDKVTLTSGSFFRKDNTENDYFLFNTDQVIALNAALQPAGAPPNVKQLTVTLIQSLDSANERLSTTLPADATYSIIGNVAQSKQIKIVATTTLPGATVTSWLSTFSYRYDNASNPKIGTRRVAFQVTDSVGVSSDVAYADIEVKSGLPIVALTGVEQGVTPIQNYTEGVGAQTVTPNATIINQSPIYRYGNKVTPDPGIYGTHSFLPSRMYRIETTGGISYIDSIQVLDGIMVTLSNPDAPGTLFDSSTEFLSYTAVPAQGLFSAFDFPANYLFYDGYYDSSDLEAPAGTGLGYSVFNEAVTTLGADRVYSVSSDPVSQRPAYYAAQASKAPAELSAFITILRSLTYTNTSNNLTANGTRRIITVKAKNTSTTSLNGGAESIITSSAQLELRLQPRNKSPVFGVASGFFLMNQTNSLNNTPLSLSGLTVSDIDGNGGQEWLTLTVSSGQLAFTTPLAMPDSATLSPDKKMLVIKGTVNGVSGTLQDFLSTQDNLQFSPNLGLDEDVTVTVTLDDRGNSSAGTPDPKILTSSFVIYVDKVNQPPTVEVPPSRIADENADRIYSGISTEDVDLTAASSNPLLLRLSAQQGRISLASTIGLDFNVVQLDNEGGGIGDGISNPVMQMRGLIDSINDATKTITYRANQNYYGPDAITVLVNDLGGVGIRPNGYQVPSEVSPSSVSGSPAWIFTKQFAVNVQFVNTPPVVTKNTALSVPIGAVVTLQGGSYTASTNYPPGTIATPVTKLPNTYVAPLPSGCGTVSVSGSNLIAQDIETKQAGGLTYTINLPVTQGTLRLSRPSMAVVNLVAGSTFTQDDLNKNYVSYAHNGALSGDDGFVFTVTDDNSATAPTSAPGVQVKGATSQQIFNLSIDRTQPIAILNGSTAPVYPEGTAPILIDNDPLTRVVNATDTTNFVLVGSTGQLTATVTIPTQLGVNPGTTSSDPQDTLTLLDQPPLGFTGQQMFYNGSPIGSYSGGNGTPLVVTLSSALPVSVAAVSETLRHLQFSNPGANLSASNRVITVTVLNGAGQVSVVASKTVQVVPVNNTPVITPPTLALVTVPGLTVGGMVQATDPDGVLSFALTGSPPTRGQVTVNATSGAFTYSPAPNPNGIGGVLTDQFEVTASDPGIPANTTVKSTSQIYQVRVTDLGAVAPVFTSNPPLETVLGRVLTYAPQVSTTGLTAPSLTYSLLGLSPAVNPGLGFNPTTGTITWPAGWSVSPVPTADSYQHLGLLVVDQANQVAAYQPIMLKILLVPRASN